MKKYIKISFLLAILIGIIVLFILNNPFEYSKEKTLTLLKKGVNCNNYSVEISDNSESIIMKQKNNIYVITSSKENDVTFKVYENSNDDEIIIMDNQYAIVSKFSEYLKKEKNTEYLLPYMNNIIEKFESDSYIYTLVEKNNNCIIVNLTKNEEEYDNINYTIDLKTGFVNKIEKFNKSGNILEKIEYKIEINNVTDEDIKKPDLTNIQIHEI